MSLPRNKWLRLRKTPRRMWQAKDESGTHGKRHGPRRNRHQPQFTKRHFFAEDKPARYLGRRAHGLLTNVAIDHAAQTSAAKRASVYLHSFARWAAGLRRLSGAAQ